MSKAWKELQEAAIDRKAWKVLEDLCPNWEARRQKAWQKLVEDPCPNWGRGRGVRRQKACQLLLEDLCPNGKVDSEGMTGAP